MWELADSVTYRFPDASTATPLGLGMDASSAGAVPGYLEPPPATVVTIPPATLRMRPLYSSATYKFPAGSVARAATPLNCALIAGPPSPEYPTIPVPATLVTVPFDTFWMRAFPPR